MRSVYCGVYACDGCRQEIEKPRMDFHGSRPPGTCRTFVFSSRLLSDFDQRGRRLIILLIQRHDLLLPSVSSYPSPHPHPLRSRRCAQPSTAPPSSCPPSPIWPFWPSVSTTGVTPIHPSYCRLQPSQPGVQTHWLLRTRYPTRCLLPLPASFLRCLTPRPRAQ